MPSDFNIVFPRKSYQKLNGGLNSKFDSQLIMDNELSEAVNVVYGTDSVETRGGTAKINTGAVGTFACDGLYTRHSSDTSQTMCAWFNGSMYILSGTTFATVPSAQSLMTAGFRVCVTEYENHMFFGNGGSIPYKYNGTDFTRHGVYPPTSAPTAVSAGSGVLSGVYQYKITYVNSASAEGDVSTASATYTIAAGETTVTIPIAPVSFGVSSRNLYRTVTSGTTFLRVKTISDNTASITTDNVADGALGAAAPTDNGVPPNYSAICYHRDRLWCNDPVYPNYIWYSELAEPYTFGSTNFIRVGDATSDLVKGITVYNDSILIFCDNSVWMIYLPDDTPANWQRLRVNSPYGCKSPFGFFHYNNKIMFPAIQNNKLVGFAAISGNGVEYETTILTVSSVRSDLKSNRIESDIFEINDSQANDISAYVYKNKAYISVPSGSGQTTNNKILVYDFSLGDLARAQKLQEGLWSNWTGLNAAQFTEYNGTLYYASSDATGFLYSMNQSTYSDSGAAIDSYCWTKEFSGAGDEEFTKDFRKFQALYYKGGNYYMDVLYKTDSDAGDGQRIQVNCYAGGSLWDTSVWDIETWGGGATEGEIIESLGQTRGKRIQFGFSNQAKVNQYFKILGLKFFYNRKGKR